MLKTVSLIISINLYISMCFAEERLCETQDQKAWIECDGGFLSRRECKFFFTTSTGRKGTLKDEVPTHQDLILNEERVSEVCQFVGSSFKFDSKLRHCLQSPMNELNCDLEDLD